MKYVAPSTVRVKRLRERRVKGVDMVAPVEVGEGGIDLLVGNRLLDQAMKNDRQAVGKACLNALEQSAMDHGDLGAPQEPRQRFYFDTQPCRGFFLNARERPCSGSDRGR